MDWSPLKLKVREAQFFAAQLHAHTSHPELFLFYLAAFLSSARSITFHVQKQFADTDRELYEKLRRAFLDDALSGFFVDLRNHSEKQGYPHLWVQLLAAHTDLDTGREMWQQNANIVLFRDADNSGLSFLRSIIEGDWDLTGIFSPPAKILYVWRFPTFPGGDRDVIAACDEFLDRLWRFVARFRAEWERKTDPGAPRPPLRPLIGPGA